MLSETHIKHLNGARQTVKMSKAREAHFREKVDECAIHLKETKMLNQLLAIINIYHQQLANAVHIIDNDLHTDKLPESREPVK